VFVRVVAFEKIRFERQNAAEVEGPAIEDIGQRNLASLRSVQLCVGVDRADPRFDLRQFGGGDKVDLVQQHHVGKPDLLLRFVAVGQPVDQETRIGNRDDRVEPGLGAHLVVDEKRLRDRCRIGKTGRLDDDAVELARAFHETADDAHQIAAHRAADAAVVHLEYFFVGADHDFVVDADFAEFIDDDGVFLAVVFAEDAVEQRGFAGSQIAGQDCDGNFGHFSAPFRADGGAAA